MDFVMDNYQLSKHFNHKQLSGSLTVRSTIIGIVALLMLVPLGFVGEAVNERGYRYNAVLAEIASTWGQKQTLMAAIVVVPYTIAKQSKETITSANGTKRLINKTQAVRRYAYFLPLSLNIDATLLDEQRQRGIFNSLVYNAEVSLEASYAKFDIKTDEDISDIHWEEAWVSVGLSDTRAINRVESLQWQGDEQRLTPGTRYEKMPTGFHALLGSNDSSNAGNDDLTDIVGEDDPANEDQKTLQLKFSMKGSESFLFAPLGETTRVNIDSRWPHPSFTGSALPDKRNISEQGFSASWDIPHLARNYQQHWTSDKDSVNLFEFTAGVSMFEPVSLYSQVTRAVKYGLLFIGLTFLTLFIFEMAIARKLHIVQYGLIGVALSLFFLVLLSLSEHIEFILAYASAAALTISMISIYVWFALSSFTRAVFIFLLLSALYAVLYSLLQFEDIALLVGTGLLVFILMVLMFVTRNIQSEDQAEPLDAQTA